MNVLVSVDTLCLGILYINYLQLLYPRDISNDIPC